MKWLAADEWEWSLTWQSCCLWPIHWAGMLAPLPAYCFLRWPAGGVVAWHPRSTHEHHPPCEQIGFTWRKRLKDVSLNSHTFCISVYNTKLSHTFCISVYNTKLSHTSCISVYNTKLSHTSCISVYNTKLSHTSCISVYNTKLSHTSCISVYNTKLSHTSCISVYKATWFLQLPIESNVAISCF